MVQEIRYLSKSQQKSNSFAPGVLEIIDALGAMDKVVGVDNWSVQIGEHLAEGINIVAEDGLGEWPEYSVEKLIENNPEIIIAPVSLASTPEVMLEDARFSSISIVINEKVYIVTDNPVSRPSQNIIKGLEMFARAIHPEIFGKFEIIE